MLWHYVIISNNVVCFTAYKIPQINYRQLIIPAIQYSLWTSYKKSSFSKIRVAYNNFYRKLLHVSGRSSASAMFVENNIPNFECLIRRDIYSFTTRLKISSNTLISVIENCWLLKFVIWKPVLIDKLFP